MEVYRPMLNYLMRIAATLFLFGLIQTTYGQKATEIFIPVGKSPGLSGYTTIGTVNTINTQEKKIVMSDSEGSYTIKIADNTKIWLDQSNLKATNKTGSFESIKEGMVVEVKYQGDKPDSSVEWIKLQMTE